jgi:DNA-binding phage protein
MIPYETKPENVLDIFGIAMRLRAANLSPAFVANVALMALEYEGTYDLMVLWDRCEDPVHRDEILADLQDEIDGYIEAPTQRVNATKINFRDLDKHVEDVLEFKRQLRGLVDDWGGISKLAEATGIPQPSLSRFFKTASLPRRTTLCRIRDALVPSHANESELLNTIEQIRTALAEQDAACDSL